MGRRRTKFTEGNYYHIYNRGCNREPIFRYRENFLYLLGLLKEQLAMGGISPIAYSLMPNHYHFLLRQDGDWEISRMIQSVFNLEWVEKRQGSLVDMAFVRHYFDSAKDYERYVLDAKPSAAEIEGLENYLLG